MGFFAQPLDGDHFWILALAWGEWGEFSFFIAGVAASDRGGAQLIDSTTYNAICLAVLVSMLWCPAGLRARLEAYGKRARFQIAEAIADTADVSGAAHATYFCLQTKSHAHWDQSAHLQTAMTKMGCEIIDYRQWHPNDHFGLAHCVNEMYIRDDHLRLPTAMDMTSDQTMDLRSRIDDILDATRAALREDEHQGAEIRVQRWLPGCHVETDELGQQHLEANEDARQRIERLASDANVYRGADGKLHGRSSGPWRGLTHQRESVMHGGASLPKDEFDEQCLDGFEVSSEVGSSHKLSKRSEPARRSSMMVLKRVFSQVLDPSESERGFEAERGATGALRAEAHHELDGFVHHDAHHPFKLPDDDDHEKEDELVFGDGSVDDFSKPRRRPSYAARQRMKRRGSGTTGSGARGGEGGADPCNVSDRNVVSSRSTTSLAPAGGSCATLPDLDEEAPGAPGQGSPTWHQRDVETADDGGTVLPLLEVDAAHPHATERPRVRSAPDTDYSRQRGRRSSATARLFGTMRRASRSKSPGSSTASMSTAEEVLSKRRSDDQAERRLTLDDLPPPPPSPRHSAHFDDADALLDEAAREGDDAA